MGLLRKNVEHIRYIVATQQIYAKTSGLIESVEVSELIEDTMRMDVEGFASHRVSLKCQTERLMPIRTNKHKVLQILINIVRNARQACEESDRAEKQVIIRVSDAGDHVRISTEDNGVGIPRENLTRIFNQGFTTRKDGHGFGLHSSALAAMELGGSLSVQSAGPGKGATFTLVIPKQPRDKTA